MNRNSQLELQEIRDISTLASLEPEWNQLWKRCHGTTPFQRPEWLVSWMEVFNPGPLWSIAVRDSGRLVGVAPMYIQIKGTERILAPVGAAISDYLDWLLDPEFADDALGSLVAFIQEHDSVFTGFDLSDLPAHSGLRDLMPSETYEFACKSHDVCPVLQLPSTVDELKSVVPHRQLRSVKTARKKIQKAGQAHIEVASTQTLDELLQSLFRLHQTRWSQDGQSGIFADSNVREFLIEVSPALLKKGVLRLYVLRFNEQIIASLYALFEHENAYCYLQGFDPEFAEFSPGAQILFAVIEDAVRQQKRSIDFLRGREAYKYAWGARDVPTYRVRGHKQVPAQEVSPEKIAA